MTTPRSERPNLPRVTTAQFREALDKTGLTRERFVRLWGCTPDRVAMWERGDDRFPFPLWVFLGLLMHNPENVERAEEIVDDILDQFWSTATDAPPGVEG